MKTSSFYVVLLVVFASGSVASQNEEELPIPVETDNQFPPEYSELDGRNEGSETTAAEPSQLSSGSTTADVSASTSTIFEETVIDEGNVNIAVESPEPTPASSLTDGAVTTSINDDVKATYNEDEQTKAAETTQITLDTTIPDVAVSASTAINEQVQDEGSETTTMEQSEPTSGSTIADSVSSTLTTTDYEISNSEVSETTTAEATETVSDGVLQPITIDEQASTNADNVTKLTELTSGSTIEEVAELALATDSEQVNNNEGAETTVSASTQTTLGSPIEDVTVPLKITNNEQDTTSTGSDTKAAELTNSTSGSTLTDLVTPTLTSQDEQNITNEGSETTTVEPSEPTAGTTIASVLSVESTLTNEDHAIDNDLSEGNVVKPMTTEESTCPNPCKCVTEGDSSNYIVDCSGYGLTELPTPIDPKTTTLKLNDNKFTVIPKAISELKNLKVLNANDNLITELESGSISELPELLSLNLANNRLLEYPKDLENSLYLNKLEELDLSGNEIKVTPEIFLNYKALRTVILPEVSPALQTELCTSLKETLVTVCTKSCNENSFNCSEFLNRDDSLDATLPGMIPFIPEIVEEDKATSNSNPTNSDIQETPDALKTSSNQEARILSNTLPDREASVTIVNSGIETTVNTVPVSEAPKAPASPAIKETLDNMPVPEISFKSRSKELSQMAPEPQLPITSSESKDNLPVSDFSLRTAVNKAPQEKVALQNIVIDTPKESTSNESDVKVGAKTTDTKGTGGVDKSIIAVIVAGMITVIAVITVKKNWSSIRKRFSSAPTPNDRSGHANGTTPEEVPLQDKSPV